jgi:uncharacterized protein YukE
MSQDILAFDIAKAETSGRKIRTEADKLKRMTDKLKRAVDGTPTWWVGSSRNGFTRQANELIGQMHKAVKLVTELGDDMTAIAKAKKEEEARLKGELAGALAVEFGSEANVIQNIISQAGNNFVENVLTDVIKISAGISVLSDIVAPYTDNNYQYNSGFTFNGLIYD